MRDAGALRVLYAEELERASRLAVELSRARQAADEAVAQGTDLRRALVRGESRVGHAEGEAAALRLRATQLQATLDAGTTALGAVNGEHVRER